LQQEQRLLHLIEQLGEFQKHYHKKAKYQMEQTLKKAMAAYNDAVSIEPETILM